MQMNFIKVAPLVGAWIEICYGVNWNVEKVSLLLQERGLKQFNRLIDGAKSRVAPLVGAWIEISYLDQFYNWIMVAPLVGAWIEILPASPIFAIVASLLLQERGLKSSSAPGDRSTVDVAPLVGAWIEIIFIPYSIFCFHVAPLVGAWIEIPRFAHDLPSAVKVAPLVGAWIEISKRNRVHWENAVAPLVGAWIEIKTTSVLNTLVFVAPLVGAWIEITALDHLH